MLQRRFMGLTPAAVTFFCASLQDSPDGPAHKWLARPAVCGMFTNNQLEHLHQFRENGVITGLHIMDRVRGWAYARFTPDTGAVKALIGYVKRHMPMMEAVNTKDTQ